MFCKTCKKLIELDEEYLHNGEDIIHIKCYLCSNCQKNLAGNFYYYYYSKEINEKKKRKLLCDKCYYRSAPICDFCLKIIEDISLNYDEKTFHLNCFSCYHCQNPFKGDLIFPYNNQIYCSKCYEHVQKDFHITSANILTLRCLICRKIFQPGDLITKHQNESEDIEYIHNSCFVCDICHINLTNSVYYLPNNQDENLKFHCKKCHEISTNICFNCFKSSDNLMIIYNNRWYHDECFKCKTCQSKLKTQTKILIESDGLLCEHCSILIHD